MRIALLTESAISCAKSAEGGWCSRLIQGLPEHEFELFALGSGRRDATSESPPVASAASGGPGGSGGQSALRRSTPVPAVLRGRGRRRALDAYRSLLRSLVEPGAEADFGPALYALAAAGRGGGLPALLRSGAALRAVEAAWQAPGAIGVVGSGAGGEPLVRDALVAADQLEQCLRPLSAPWYPALDAPAGGALGSRRRWLPWSRVGPGEGLARVDVCHAVGGGLAVLPGLLAKHFYGIPLIITEHSLHLRERARGYRDAPYRPPVRALLLAFFRLLAREGYRQAGLITPGSEYDRRWQIHCGADQAAIRVVHEGTDEADLPAVGAEPGVPTLAWSGPIEPRGGLERMLRAFAALREEAPDALLRVYGEAPAGAQSYAEQCRALARTLFPATGDGPEAVLFEGRPARLRAVHEHGTVLVFSGTDGPPPRLLAEAMLSGRPVVATDVGAAREVVGPTGLLVPPDDPRALAAACAALLCDQERRARLGSAGRLRAQELYAVEPAAAAFRELYLELVSRWPGPAERSADVAVARQPFSRPAELWVAAALAATVGSGAEQAGAG